MTLRSYVMGSNDAILREGGRTTVVSLAGANRGPRGASGDLLVVPPGNVSLGAGGQLPINGNGVYTTGASQAAA
jgi:hypothetical protein